MASSSKSKLPSKVKEKDSTLRGKEKETSKGKEKETQGQGALGKRCRPTSKDREFVDYGTVNDEVPAATVHGVICSLSPMKKSRGNRCSYFDGIMSDGKNSMRFVGFSSRLQYEMEQHHSKKEIVQLKDCQIKQARRGEKFELLLKSDSGIKKSPVQLDLSMMPQDASECPVVAIKDVESLKRFDRVTVKVKVKELMDHETIPDGSIKQDALVADSTGLMRVSVWGDYVGRLRLNVCYSLTNFMVKEYFGAKYLTMGRSPRSEIEEIVDIGTVLSAGDGEVALKRELKNAEIVGVDELEKHKSCFRCKGRVEPPADGCDVGKCSRPECGMFQRYEACGDQWSAKLVMSSSQVVGTILLSVYGRMVKELAGVAEDADVKAQMLLQGQKLNVVYTPGPQNVVTAFQVV